MTLHLFGVNHSTCPIEIRERLACLGAKAALKALAKEGFEEAVVVSTCNRFEAYVTAPGNEGEALRALAECVDRFVEGFGTASEHAYLLSRATAAKHLFRVAAGLDSLVIGETEILGQVKRSYSSAVEEARAGKTTNVLFQRAFFIGKAVRSRTHIAMGQVSAAAVAVELARRIFGRLAESKVLILGAGEMAVKTATYFKGAKASRISFANRTWEKARTLSIRFDAETVHWDDFPARLSEADIVVASTGATEPIVTLPMVEASLGARGGRSLFFIDIAMPRDVGAGVGELDGVYVYGMEDLQAIVSENAARRRSEVAAADLIIEREAAQFGDWLDALDEGKDISLRHSERPRRPRCGGRSARRGRKCFAS